MAAMVFLATEGPAQSDANFDQQVVQGKTVYGSTCAQCHYEGAGSATAPDLQGSTVLAGPPEPVLHLILFGQSGISVRNGVKFPGEMAPQAFLTNEEIAAVTAYVRSVFADKRELVSPEAVEKLRVK